MAVSKRQLNISWVVLFAFHRKFLKRWFVPFRSLRKLSEHIWDDDFFWLAYSVVNTEVFSENVLLMMIIKMTMGSQSLLCRPAHHSLALYSINIYLHCSASGGFFHCWGCWLPPNWVAHIWGPPSNQEGHHIWGLHPKFGGPCKRRLSRFKAFPGFSGNFLELSLVEQF